MKTVEVLPSGQKVVSREEWLAARVELLKKEKELTRLRDEQARQRRDLPCVKVEKEYRFDGPHGPVTLAGLFGGRSQLVVYHFMFGPDWAEGCPSCSFIADWLARVLVQRLPAEPEARGLLALMLHCEARRLARRTQQGEYVPLSEQNATLWDAAMTGEAERELASAFTHGRPGRFQLEAAIQSVHAERAVTGRTDWAAIATFYEHLVRLAPTLGARVGHAAAVAEATGPEAGLALLDALDTAAVSTYQPHWAVRAHLLERAGRSEARDAFDRAITLAEDDAVRQFLLRRRG